MNILFLPTNIASMPSITAAAFSKHKGVQAISLIHDVFKSQSLSPQTVYIPKHISRKKIWKYIWNEITLKGRIKKWIEWADVLHYSYNSDFENGIDLKWAHNLKKPIFIEWVGSDIRNPEFLIGINKYFEKAFHSGYEYAFYESKERSLGTQKLFAKYGAIPLLSPEMSLFLSPTLFPKSHLLFQRINTKDFLPKYPYPNNKKPLIIHSPTAKICKGSNYIIPLIEELRREYDFDFQLLHNMKREEVLNLMKDCDIFLDQLVLGSYGMAAMEAMSFGKPVMCYIMPEVFKAGLPIECPIYNTNPDTLKQNLIELISKPELRHHIGIKSRAYVEKYHDVEQITLQLLSIYQNELEPVHK
jgi:glycosyltransferase involved in cell wall biosynthesis